MTHAAPGDERRSSPRAPINEFVELDRDHLDDSARALALNVSNSGMAVAHCLLGQVGDHVNCRMLFTPHEPLRLGCRIVWVREATDEQPAAMGLCFEDITETRVGKLDTLVARIRGRAEATPLTGIPIDPFCEPGTWREDEGSDTFDDLSSRGSRPGGYYQQWVAPQAPKRQWAPRGSMSWRLVVFVGVVSLLGTLAVWLAAYLLLVQ